MPNFWCAALGVCCRRHPHPSARKMQELVAVGEKLGVVGAGPSFPKCSRMFVLSTSCRTVFLNACRRHPPPSARKMQELVAVGEKLGVKVDDRTAGALALSLQAMRDACKDEATSSVRVFTVC